MGVSSQENFDFRFDWASRGVEKLGTISDSIVIVDVLSFSTAVDIAVSRGAIVYPYIWRDDTVTEFAQRVGAKLAVKRRDVSDENRGTARMWFWRRSLTKAGVRVNWLMAG